MRKENKEFLTYIAKYLGVALIAGSVVHIGTLDNGTTRYFVLALVGLVLMLTGNIAEAKQTNQKINLKFFLSIIALSFATGFLSGGVQHYLDNPSYASWLLGIGLLVSYVAFFMKDKVLLNLKNVAVVTVISLALLLSPLLLQSKLAEQLHLETEQGSAHSH